MESRRDGPPAARSRAVGESERTRTDTSEDLMLADALSACRSALERQLVGLREDGPRRSELEAVRAHLVHFAQLAAERKVPPERALVMLKRVIRELPPIMPWRETQRENISHELIHMMITAYFGGDGTGAASVPPGHERLPGPD